ncbi:hypothetical protein MKX07_004601 [Trichoderma sp. CBMAI-0711]|uniref:Uncharacterized protein n=1 Tax=Trichoderma parareesei TaxID=858221 RepID=A0A2H2ZYP0_TRIPA|nr:hypothetical protein MKX07_004601 [Trichoderma sp. CBMAI-0711]OTA06996.1 hypothetical protein A9Z42_0078120 [Trichoderma parareesei]
MAHCWRRAWAAVKCGRSEAVRWPVHGCWGVPDAWGDQWHCAAATADAAAAAPPCAHEDAAVGLSVLARGIQASYGLSPAPGRAERGGDWARGLAEGVCSWQSKHPEYARIPSSSGASEGLRSPLGLTVEDERLPWSLEAPGGEG